jgi:bile acid-coenzyme A ligase
MGEDTEPVSLVRRIAALAEERGDERALVYVAVDGSEPSMTYADLHRRSSQLAGALAERGLGFGDRLGIGLRNSPEFVLAVFASWKLGAVPIPMRWDLPEWELTRLRSVVDGKVHLEDGDLDWIRSTEAREVPELAEVVSPATSGICSSGSTGLPKVIVSNQPAWFNAGRAAAFTASWGAEVARPQEVMVLGPMYHVNGFNMVHNLAAGDHAVLMEKFDAARVVDAIERYRVSMFNCTPTMLKRMADVPDIDQRDLSSINCIVQGAAPLAPYLAHRWIELVGAEHFVMAYGMSELLGVTAIRGDEWLAHEGSVGRGINQTEMKVLDADGVVLPAGEVGEVFMRSPLYGGSTYLGEAPQLPSTPDGYQSVGDLGYLDDDGFLYIVDRRVDLIITGGVNVFPAEVETALLEHPAVADVVVVGLKDDEWGRRVHAIVQPHDLSDPPSLEELRAYAKTKLHVHKAPKSLEVVDAIPRSAATKVNRGALVDERGG